MYPQPIKKLIELFSKFPAVGPRTAARFVFYLLNSKKGETEELTAAIKNLKEQTGICAFCFNPFDSSLTLLAQGKSRNLCPICASKTRQTALLCVVEKESDLEAIEKTGSFRGLYFILGGTAGQLKKKEIEGLRIKELQERVKANKIQEVILATNLTTEGETTALYLERVLGHLGVKTTRLGRGLPIGGELEYADEETLRQAFEGRR